MSSSLVPLMAAESSEGFGALGYGIAAFAILIFLLMVTVAFRSVWTRRR
ncbi:MULTISPECIES: hypothetical protein [unclassified Pseudactinotalea]|nr:MULTISPECIES: hypothetical protein [unclassified Pseudactinotalea]QGH69793.1 hypothetical protein GCE65_09930 [Pseudactinotalea sp. HY158]